MKTMFAIFMALLFISAVPAHCQDDQCGKKIPTIEGNITSFDWVSGRMAVNGMMMIVPPGTIIYKGVKKIGTTDVNVGDAVRVIYSDDPSGMHKALKIFIRCDGDC